LVSFERVLSHFQEALMKSQCAADRKKLYIVNTQTLYCEHANSIL